MKLTLQFIPYADIKDLPAEKRVAKLLKLVKSDKIILLEGKLRRPEEGELIRRTMEEINDKFKGIELSVIYPNAKDNAFWSKIKGRFINIILGDRNGFTIIGPASIVKEIKQDPDKIQLFTK